MSECEKMKIVSKADANAILRHLVRKGVPVEIEKFDSGKYKWSGTQKDYIGKEVQKLPGVEAVYVERRQDRYGVYAQFFSVTNMDEIKRIWG